MKALTQNSRIMALFENVVKKCYKSYKIHTCKDYRYVIKYTHKQMKPLTFYFQKSNREEHIS